MSIKRAFVWNGVFLLCSMTVAVVAGGLLLLADVSPSRSVGETVLIIVFFGCYTALLVLYWYRNTYQPDQPENVT
jgi:hypothetical protein